jgi:DNA-binding Xre family transcriptional regulator
MSSKDLAAYLEQRIVTLKISTSELARRADISRQTWYRLLSADLTDAKLSTMMRLADALETTPMHLLSLYFNNDDAANATERRASAAFYCPPVTEARSIN